MAVQKPTQGGYASGAAHTGTIAPERIRVYRLDEVFHRDPYKNPLLTLLNAVGLTPCSNNKFEWLERDRTRRTSQVVSIDTIPATISDFDVTVTSTHGVVFMVDQLIYFPATEVVARVISISGDVLTCQEVCADDAGVPGSLTNPNANDEILIIGTAFPEASSKPESQHIQPSNEFNYIGEHRDTWAISKQMMATDVYGNPEAQALALETMGVHKSSLERSLWWGKRQLVAGSDSSGDGIRYISGGVLERLTTHVSATSLASYTFDNLVDDCTPLFEENPGQTYFAFCGPQILNRFSKRTFQADDASGAGYAPVTITNERPMMSEAFGLRITELVMPHGTLKLIPHYEIFRTRPTLADPGSETELLAYQMVVLDLDLVQGCTLAGHGIGVIEENLQSPGDHKRIDGITSDLGLMLKHESKHMKFRFTA